MGITYFLVWFGVLACVYYLNKDNRHLEIGQIWICTYNNENPFDESYQVKFLIIDIKDDYVKYLEIREEREKIYSCKKEDFATSGKLQKNPTS